MLKLIIELSENDYKALKEEGVQNHLALADTIIAHSIPYDERSEEKPFITECRNASIEQNLPLYFVYYEETGILEVYVTETKELFEKRHCSKHLPDYKFKEIVINYLDWYSDWKAGIEE